MSDVYFQGPVMYAKVFERNRDKNGPEGKFKEYNGMYTLTLGLDDDDAEYVQEWSHMYKPKKFGKKGFKEENNAVEGKKYYTFKRRHEHRDGEGDIIDEWSGPPTVVDADGEPWDESVDIGNGSIVTVKLNVRKPRGSSVTYIRLEKIRVDEWVEYEGGEVEDEEIDLPPEQASLPF